MFTDTTSGSGAEGDEGVKVSVGGPLGEETVRVENVEVGVELFAAMKSEGGDDDGCVSRKRQGTGRCKRHHSQPTNHLRWHF